MAGHIGDDWYRDIKTHLNLFLMTSLLSCRRRVAEVESKQGTRRQLFGNLVEGADECALDALDSTVVWRQYYEVVVLKISAEIQLVTGI